MQAVNPEARPGRCRAASLARTLLAVGLLAAGLVAACGGKQPEPAVTSVLPAMPADHPPLAAAGTPADRLPPDAVLATVAGAAVTAADLDAAIAAMPGPERLEYTAPEMVRDLVEALVDRRLMAAEATAARLTSDPSEQGLAAAWRAAELARVVPPTDAEIASYYSEHGAEFMEPARVLVTRATAASLDAAGALRAELERGTAAPDLTAGDAGQVWLQDAEKVPEPTALALALREGEVSRAIAIPGGFLVMRADELRPARQRPLDEVRAGIQSSLEEARRQALVADWRERLRKGVSIKIDESVVASYAAPVQDPP